MCVCVVCGCIYLYAHMCACMYGCVLVYVLPALGPVERVYLSAPIVAIRGKEANLTAVVWPSHTRTLTFFWWFDNSSEVRSFSSHSHYCSTHTFCPVYFSLFHSPTLLLMSLCCCLQNVNLVFTQIMWNVAARAFPMSFLEDPARMAGHIYLSRWLCSLQLPLIIQYVKGCMYGVFYIRLRGCGLFCEILCVFSFWNPAHYNLGGKHLLHFSERGEKQGHGPGCFWEHHNAGFKSDNC